jgi:hypothetical protein
MKEMNEEGLNLDATASSSCWLSKGELGKAPCQNCGRLVIIVLPFVGCVFCGDCNKEDTWNGADSEYFKISSYSERG